MVFKLGQKTKLELLERSIRSIVGRHEILRTLIKEDKDGNGYQVVLDDNEYPLEIRKLRLMKLMQLDEELHEASTHIYNLSSEYPIKVGL